MTIGKDKRPRDLNKLAKWIVEQTPGQTFRRQRRPLPVYRRKRPLWAQRQYGWWEAACLVAMSQSSAGERKPRPLERGGQD